MTKNEYNGWTNYETWSVHLWLTNDSDTETHWRERAGELLEECKETLSANARLTGVEPFTTEEKAVMALEKELKESVEENSPLTDGDLYTDLLNAALSEVNWHEIAKSFVDC